MRAPLASAEFTAYHASHWVVLGVAAVGAAGLVMLGRRADPVTARRCARCLAALILLLNLGMELVVFQPANPVHTLPLQLSDLAPYASAYALWSRRPWAYSLTYYWGITLSTQALFTPVLRGSDFPSVSFLAFFTIHVLVVWAAIYLTWGLRLRPDWPGYRFTVAVTVSWAAAMVAINSLAGTNYGFLNAKPPTGSLLDLFGPWPEYLLPEAAAVLAGWALMTVGWRRRAPHPPREVPSA